MLTAFTRAFKTPDLRRKLLFTLAIVVIFRLGSHVPVPGVSYTAVQACIKGADAPRSSKPKRKRNCARDCAVGAGDDSKTPSNGWLSATGWRWAWEGSATG